MKVSDEVKAKIIAAYQNNDKVQAIMREYKIEGAVFYAILKEAHVPYRRASHGVANVKPKSKATGDHAPATAAPSPVPVDQTRRERCEFSPLALARDEITYFRGQMNEKIKRYGPNSVEDSWGETWMEYVDHLEERLELWVVTLAAAEPFDVQMGNIMAIDAFLIAIRGIHSLLPNAKTGPKKEG